MLLRQTLDCDLPSSSLPACRLTPEEPDFYRLHLIYDPHCTACQGKQARTLWVVRCRLLTKARAARMMKNKMRKEAMAEPTTAPRETVRPFQHSPPPMGLVWYCRGQTIRCISALIKSARA